MSPVSFSWVFLSSSISAWQVTLPLLCCLGLRTHVGSSQGRFSTFSFPAKGSVNTLSKPSIWLFCCPHSSMLRVSCAPWFSPRKLGDFKEGSCNPLLGTSSVGFPSPPKTADRKAITGAGVTCDVNVTSGPSVPFFLVTNPVGLVGFQSKSQWVLETYGPMVVVLSFSLVQSSSVQGQFAIPYQPFFQIKLASKRNFWSNFNMCILWNCLHESHCSVHWLANVSVVSKVLKCCL